MTYFKVLSGSGGNVTKYKEMFHDSVRSTYSEISFADVDLSCYKRKMPNVRRIAEKAFWKHVYSR
jgi:hypothetical protein